MFQRLPAAGCRSPLLLSACAICRFVSLGYTEYKTSQFIDCYQIERFKLAVPAEVFKSSRGVRWIRSAIYPNLLARVKSDSASVLGCELGSVQIGSLITRRAVCLIGGSEALSNLVWHLGDCAVWPVVFEAKASG